MIIEIDENHRVNFDGVNYMPEFFKKGSEMKVAGRDLKTEDTWKSYGKYYSKLSTALSFLARQSLAETNSSLTLGGYIAQLENVLKRYEKLTEF